MTLRYNTCLYHHGVKGMRWGIRRYQNEDGSLTDRGKQHYGIADGGNKRLYKAYKKELKRYGKWRDKANVELQRKKALKHIKLAGSAAAMSAALIAANEDAVDALHRLS